ncbi:Transposase [Mesomycoplasma hyorhinis DBS 1050]|nr:Transposase [Mesomycoplasma hyorhinis DBS 1050]
MSSSYTDIEEFDWSLLSKFFDTFVDLLLWILDFIIGLPLFNSKPLIPDSKYFFAQKDIWLGLRLFSSEILTIGSPAKNLLTMFNLWSIVHFLFRGFFLRPSTPNLS